MSKAATPQFNLEKVVQDILGTIDREREREIIARRFGLFDRKETLEQIGELLGITRERVRQLEKAALTKLRDAARKDLPHIKQVENVLLAHLKELGNVARVNDLASRLSPQGNKIDQARLSFLGRLSPAIAVIDDSDHFYHALGVAAEHAEKVIEEWVDKIIKAIEEIGRPTPIDAVKDKVGHPSSSHVAALAGISKNLAQLGNSWGLIQWPLVNPKNIRDKIYLILRDNGKHMHFSQIAEAIKKSSFKRKDVTTQAIHNELIKDSRFVLIGRGIYALREWGYKQGTVADVIADILRKEGGPLHRDEIVRRVLKNRYVKETTILLNLQGKPQFRRVAKATYALGE